MDSNSLRRLNWLWKYRHRHDDDDTDQQLIIIREIIDTLIDSSADGVPGAHMHLTRAVTQSIGVGGEAIEWDELFATLPALETFVSLPATEVGVSVRGYYAADIRFGWDGVTPGGTVQVFRVRDEADTLVWPPSFDDGAWTAEDAEEFEGFMPAVDFEVGDAVKVVVDHNTGSAVDLRYATLGFYLVDRIPFVLPSHDPCS